MAEADDGYAVKKVHYYGREVPILLQAENGPCPLLAIANVLTLKGQLTARDFRNARQVSFSNLVNLVAGLLLEQGSGTDECVRTESQENQEQRVQDAMGHLEGLQVGLDLNLKFKGCRSMEYTTQLDVFDLLGIDLVHGWLVDPQEAATVAAVGTMSYNQLMMRQVECDVARGGGEHQQPAQEPSQPEKDPKPVPKEEAPPTEMTAQDSEAGEGVAQAVGPQSKPTAQDLLIDRGPAGLGAYLEDNPQSPARIQDEMRGVSLLGGVAILPSEADEERPTDGQGHAPQGEATPTPAPAPEAPTSEAQAEGVADAKPTAPEDPATAAEAESKREALVKEGRLLTSFLEASQSQLTYHGLTELHSALQEGQIAVFFRNNHYSVLHKHQGMLFNLVTDEGYLRVADVVWERLDNVEGDCDFFDGEFRRYQPPPPQPTAESTGATDADAALARQLQEEEARADAEAD